jgi:tetratricopeptide (TPR) repeat protein
MAKRAGQLFGNYRLLSVLGEGHFATVYLAEHIHLGTFAAIKVLKIGLFGDESAAFRAEARVIARLIHPHIVRVLEFGIKRGIPFLVMDHAPNGTLGQRYPNGTHLPFPTVLSYVTQVATALHYAHQQKVIHRDIKPENMLLGAKEEVLLSDFGLAIVTSSSRQQSVQDIAGTIAYMAPEQHRGEPCLASDQYALGVVVYQWLSGSLPFQGHPKEIIIQHIAMSPPSLCRKVATLSPAIENVVFRALAKDPHDRFPSVEAFATALQQADQGIQASHAGQEVRAQFSQHYTAIPFGRAPQHALIGRERELAILHQMLQETEEQRWMQPTDQDTPPSFLETQPLYRPYLSLFGDAGIGKTRLVEDISLQAQQRGWAVLWARAHPQEQHMAYHLWIAIIRNALAYDYLPWQEMYENSVRYQLLVALIPELAEIFPSLQSAPDDSGEQTQFRIREALRALFSAISTSLPLLIVLDDLHWADNSSCDVLGYLTRKLADQRVLLLSTCRENELSSGHPLRPLLSMLRQQRMMTSITLPPLTESQIGQLVAHVPESFAKYIQRQAAGNPFFAEELARFPTQEERTDEHIIPISPSRSSILPPSIAEVFEQRFARLSKASQKILSYAAVMGNAFSLDLVRLMGESTGASIGDEETILDQLDEALQAGLLAEESTGAHIIYRFWHPLLGDYLYGRLSAARQAHLHRRVAHVLQETHRGREAEEAAAITYHLVAGGAQSSLIAHYARLAGDHDYKLYAYPEAEKHYRLALQHSGDLSTSADHKQLMRYALLLECVGECASVLGKFDEARQMYEQTLHIREQRQSFNSEEEEQYEAQWRALLWCEVGQEWRHLGDSNKARECFKQGELVLTNVKVVDGPAWAAIRLEQGYTCWFAGNVTEGLDMTHKSLCLLEASLSRTQSSNTASFLTRAQRRAHGDPVDLGRVYSLLAILEILSGQSSDALDHFSAALAIYEHEKNQRGIANICCNLADLYLQRSEYAQARTVLMRSKDIAEQIGDIPSVSIVFINLSLLAERSGDLTQADSWARKSLALAEQINNPFYISLFHGHIAMVLIEQGRLDEAERFLLQSLRNSRAQRISRALSFALVVLGQLRIAQTRAKRDESKKCDHCLQRAKHSLQSALLIEEQDTETRMQGKVTLVEVLWLQGELAVAEQQALEVIKEAQKHELVWLEVRAWHFLGTILTANGKQEEGERHFHEATERLQHCGMRLEYARALRNYGTVLVQQNLPEESAFQRGCTYLKQAQEIFHACHAELDREETEYFLTSIGL